MVNFYSLSLPAVLARTLLALLLLALRLPAAAQAPTWQSARAVAVATAAGNFSEVRASAVDAVGNVYLAGIFSNTVVLGGTTLTSFGARDVFVVKFNPASNQFVWAQRAGGTGDDLPTALAVSGTNVYMVGYFNSPTASFGPVTLANAGGSAGTNDVFITKLTDAGNAGSFGWTQQAGGMGNDYASALAVSGASAYVAGRFNSPTASFGSTTLTSAGLYDVFVAKLTDAGSTGSFGWVQQVGGTTYDQATALAVSGTSVYVAGDFISPTVSFGTTIMANAGASGSSDVFIAKLTDTGNFVWVQRAAGVGNEVASALAVSGTSIYVAGNYASPSAGFGASTLTNAGANDVFVAKLSDAGSTGSFVWAQQVGGTGQEYASALAVSGTNVCMAGFFASPTASFGPVALANVNSNGTNDVFVTKLTDAGSTSRFVWAQQAGGTGIDVANTLAVSGANVYVAGSFISPTASFGTIILSNSNSNNPLGFLATLTDPTLTATTTSQALAPGQLYPNPAHGTATLRLPAGAVPTSLMLTDALGRAVRHYPAPAGTEAALDLRGLPAGLYLLRGAGLAQRLVVE